MISVVIPSLGGRELSRTLDKIVSISLITEVLLVLPPNKSFEYENSKVSILNSPYKGQVGQRCYGLKKVNNDILLLLDDDIFISEEVVRQLFDFCNLDEAVAVSPILCDLNTRRPLVSHISKAKRFLYSIIFRVKKPGGMNSVGIVLSFVVENAFKPQKVDWLPGGVIMCHANKAIDYDYFEGIEGKAYSEDVLNSALRTKLFKTQHFIIPNAFAYTKVDNRRYNFWTALRIFTTRYKVARRMGASHAIAAPMLILESILMFLLQK